MSEPTKRLKYSAAQAQRGPGQGGPGARGGYQKPKDTKKSALRLLGYMTEKKLPLLLVALCLIVETLTSIYGTYMLRPIINGLIDATPFADKIAALLRNCILLFALYVIGSATTYLQAYTMMSLAQNASNRLRRDLFNALEALPLSYFDRYTHGELMSRFTNDADNVSLAMEQSFVNLVSSVLNFIGLVVAMLYTCPPLFVVTAIVLAASLYVFKVFGGRSRRHYREQQAALGQVNGDIQEVIEGLKVVKAFTHEEIAKKEFEEFNEAYRAMGLDLGGFAAYLIYARQIGRPVNQVSQQLSAILSALAGAERIFEVMDTQPEIDEGKVTLTAADGGDGSRRAWAWKKPDGTLVPLRGDVRLVDVDFRYVPDKPVLQDVSVYAEPGQKIAFVGSTGAGKTTVTNLINRFYEIEDGVITYDGIDVRDISKDSLRRSLGAVLQDTHLFTGTVMDNIRYGRLDATDEECIAAAKSANAHGFIRHLPDGYDTVVTGDGANLSQGQRQLLAIARAAVADPPVMVLDEATSSIDTRTEQHIQRGMDALMQGRTVFVIAHRLSTVRNADCIVVIEHGQILEKGTHEELLALKGRYYMLYTGQNILE